MGFLKKSINDCNMNLEDWEETAQDRSAWRYEVAQGVRKYEEDRIEEAKVKRAKRKAAMSIDNSSSLHVDKFRTIMLIVSFPTCIDRC